jgi:uncharacterized membrane protein YqjE
MSDEGVPPSDRGLPGALARFADSALGLVRSRADLAALELEEERDRLLRSLMRVVAATMSLMFAILGVAAFVVVYFWDTHRLEAVAGVTIAFALLGGGLAWREISTRRAAPPVFAATRAELEKDREWLSRSARREEPQP